MKIRLLQKCAKTIYKSAVKGDYQEALQSVNRFSPGHQRKIFTEFNNKAFQKLGNEQGSSLVVNFAAYKGFQKGLKDIGGTEKIVQNISESITKDLSQSIERASQKALSELPQSTWGWVKFGAKNTWIDLKQSTKKATNWLKAKFPTKTSTAKPTEVKTTPKPASKAIKVPENIPEDLKPIFANLEGKTGQEFINTAYKNTVKYMKLKGVAPKNIAITSTDGLTVTGGYDPIQNTIEFSEGFLSKLPHKEQLKLISHELTHCKQFSTMLRTEGIGIKAYARAIAENSVNSAINGSSTDIMFKMRYQKAVANGKEEEFIQKAIDNQVKSMIPQIEKNFADVLKMPKIPANSPEGKKAYEYLEAQRNYEGLNIIGLGGDAYKNNPLEVEAYGFGDKMADLFEQYTK